MDKNSTRLFGFQLSPVWTSPFISVEGAVLLMYWRVGSGQLHPAVKLQKSESEMWAINFLDFVAIVD